jgi:hypothetical protein
MEATMPYDFNVPVLDRDKLKAAVHFVCHRCPPEELGNVKLHKILYFADMLTYSGSGRALTGVEYQKQPFGPTAKHVSWALRELERDGALRIVERDYYGFKKKDFISLKSPSASSLTNAESHLLEELIGFVCSKTAREISEFSHNTAWEAAGMGETIPYFTVHGWEVTDVSDEDVAFGIEEARKLRPTLNGLRHAS